MADITDDLLRTLAAGDAIAMLLVATAGTPQGRELRAIASGLLAARAEVKWLRGLIRGYVQATDDLAAHDSAETQSRYESAEDALREAARG